MASIRNLKDNGGNVFYPLTHERAVKDSNGVSLESKLAGLESKSYVEAWDGASTPVVANIPAGVTVTYNTTTYTGTLAASASTIGKIYLVKNGSDYDRYITSQSGSSYSWVSNGSTAMDLSGYATDEELEQLDFDVNYKRFTFDGGIQGKYIAVSGTVSTWADGYISDYIEVKAGMSVTAYCATDSDALAIAFYNTNKVFDATGKVVGTGARALQKYTSTAPVDGFVRCYTDKNKIPTAWIDSFILIKSEPVHEYDIRWVNDSVPYLDSRALTNRFIGNGNSFAQKTIYGLIPNHRYRIYLPVTSWDMTGVTVTGSYKFEVWKNVNGVDTSLIIVPIGQTVEPYYEFETPANFNYIGVGGRAAVGAMVEFVLSDSVIDDIDNPLMIPQKANDFSLLFKDTTGPVESFLYFTDPHWYSNYNTEGMNPIYLVHFKNITLLYEKTPTDFVLCGGDWLNDHKKSVAVKDLANIDALMNKTFNAYFPMFGNHDNNYQGELDGTSDTSANDGVLTNQEMINLWFRKWGKMYYSFKGTESTFYIFDSGIDWEVTMTSYRWEQVQWFAESLMSNSDEHIVIGIHIVCNDGYVFTENIGQLANNVLLVAKAFNARQSITMNGQTYNFASATGKVHCAICGHTHYDATAVINDIPVFCTTTAQNGDFDLVLLDYGANKLKSVRVGTGSNREMNLA